MGARFKTILFCILLTGFLATQSMSQERDNKVRKPFNAGLSWGMGGAHIAFFPSFDFSYKPVMLRVSPGYSATTIGVTTEITQISKVFNISRVYDHWYWVGSAYYSRKTEGGQWPFLDYSNFDLVNTRSMMLTTGLKVVSGKRIYSMLQVGVVREKSEKILTGDWRVTYSPHIEFSLGVHLFENYRIKDQNKQD